MRHVWAGLAGSAAMLGGGAAEAAFTPPNLPPGSGYRVIFMTIGMTDPVSSAIGDYDAFVTAQAALNPDLPTTTWKVIGSTDSVAAVDHIACGASCDALPIYNVNGVKVADSIADFFDGTVLVALTVKQDGTSDNSAKVWTGSTEAGAQFVGNTLGSPPGDGVRAGRPSETTFGRFLSEETVSGFVSSYRLYGISGALSIPSEPEPVPAPGGIALMLLGLGALGAVGMRRGRAAG